MSFFIGRMKSMVIFSAFLHRIKDGKKKEAVKMEVAGFQENAVGMDLGQIAEEKRRTQANLAKLALRRKNLENSQKQSNRKYNWFTKRIYSTEYKRTVFLEQSLHDILDSAARLTDELNVLNDREKQLLVQDMNTTN